MSEAEREAGSSPGGVPEPTSRPFDMGSHLAWIRTRLAAERTLMAWSRTSLSLIGFGFTIYQFFEKIHEATGGGGIRPQEPRILGLAFMAVGTFGCLIAIWQYQHLMSYLSRDEFKAVGQRPGLPGASQIVVLTVFLAAIGSITFLWMLRQG